MHLSNDENASLRSEIKSMNQCFSTNSFSSSSQIQLCSSYSLPAAHFSTIENYIFFPENIVVLTSLKSLEYRVQISNLLSILILCTVVATTGGERTLIANSEAAIRDTSTYSYIHTIMMTVMMMMRIWVDIVMCHVGAQISNRDLRKTT